MAETELQGEIAQRYAALPTALKAAIAQIDAMPTVKAIAEKYHLHLDTMEKLRQEIVLVLFGETVPQQFSERLQERLGVEQSIADEMTKTIDAEIFEKVRDSLKVFTGEAGTPADEITVEEGELGEAGAATPRIVSTEPKTRPSEIASGATKLSAPTAAAAQVVTVAADATPKPAAAPDPYREPVN